MKTSLFKPRFYVLLGLTILIINGCQGEKDLLTADPHRLQPAIQIITPSNNSTVSGTLNITFMITNLVPDSLAVIELWVDDQYSGRNATAAAESIEWNTAAL